MTHVRVRLWHYHRAKLRVLAEHLGARQREAVQVLARNNPPVFPCVVCGQEATQVCTQCIYEDEGWLCDACAPSTRVGMRCHPWSIPHG